MRWLWALAGVALASGCARGEPAAEAPVLPPAAAGELGVIASLETRYAGDSVRLVLHVTNATDGPMALEFATAQRFDFAVLDREGAEVWSWAADRSFAQVLGTATLAAGQTVDYEAVWEPAGAGGKYTAVGRLTSTNKPIEMRTEFEIPGR